MIRKTCLLVALCTAVYGETAVQRLLEDKLLFERVREIARSVHGVIGVAAIDLSSGRVFVFNGEAEFPAASTIKVPVMAALFRDVDRAQIRLDEKVTLEPAEAVGGSGNLQNALAKSPVTLTIRGLVEAMIRDSDNTAANRCIALAGKGPINALATERAMRATVLRRVMMDTAAAARGDENTTSPLDMARFMADLYAGKLSGAESTREMMRILELVNADIRKTIPSEIRVASKPGDLTGVHCETGIVLIPGRPYVLSVYSTFLDDSENPVPAVSEAAYRYFRKLADSNPYGNRVR